MSCDCADFDFNKPDLFVTDSLGTYTATYNGTFGRWFTCCLGATVSSVTGINSGILNPCNCTISSGTVPYLYTIDWTPTGDATLCGTFKVKRYWPVLQCSSPAPTQYRLAQATCSTSCPTFGPSFRPAFNFPGTCSTGTQIGTCPTSAPYFRGDTGTSSLTSRVTTCTPDVTWSGTLANPFVPSDIDCVTVPDVLSGTVTIST